LATWGGFNKRKERKMVELERELTFLVTELPADLGKFPSKIIEDNFVPRAAKHPIIRIRRRGDNLMITKKYPTDSADNDCEHGDSSRQVEHTISLTRAEYDALNVYDGKKFKKRRFAYKIDGYTAELDVFLDALVGLVKIDFEFDSEDAMSKFRKPAICGPNITQDEALAGGMLAGKSYADISEYLRETYDYQPVKGVDKYGEEK
jgi:CYTH domain-containing protein